MEDGDGYLFFLGRMKDMIRKKGENISAPEVEGVINSHADVVESAVIGVMTDDALGEEEIKAFIVMKGRVNEYDWTGLVGYCSERLADFKVPRYWELIEELPKNAMNRVMKKRLSRELLKSYDRTVKNP